MTALRASNPKTFGTDTPSLTVGLLLRARNSQGLEISLVDSTVGELYSLQIVAQRLLHLFFRGPMLSHFLKGCAWSISEGDNRVPIYGFIY
jgi:hypothetical protein